ncbi:MAG: hypothetical protein WCF85_21260 [Rhodospirillaceae bacterium]
MTDIPVDWPLSFKPEQASFYIQTLTAKFTNPFTSHVQVLERDGARWLARMALRFSDDRARAFDAFLAGLRGVVEVMVPDFRRLTAAGSLAGTPVLASGAGTTLTVTGFTPNASAVLKAGDLIQTNPGRAHLVLADVTAGANGTASFKVAPRLREPVTAGLLVTNNCRVRMRLITDDAGANQTVAPVKSSYQIDLCEVLPS